MFPYGGNTFLIHLMSLVGIQLDERSTFVEEPILTLACDIKQLCIREIPIVKVHSRHRQVEYSTLEI